MALRQNLGQGDMPSQSANEADLSEQEELGSAHQLNQLTKATGEQEEQGEEDQRQIDRPVPGL